MKIEVPFVRKTIFGLRLKYRTLDFVFNIGTLEAACERLNIDFWQMSEVDGYDFVLAVLYEAYLQGCRHRKPKYTFNHAVYWNEHMSRESANLVQQAMTELMGKLKKGSDGVKKK